MCGPLRFLSLSYASLFILFVRSARRTRAIVRTDRCARVDAYGNANERDAANTVWIAPRFVLHHYVTYVHVVTSNKSNVKDER